MGNLMTEFTARGLSVDLLRVQGHGPHEVPDSDHFRLIELGSAHTYTSLGQLVSYLKNIHPRALLCDKHKVNLVALWARALARVDTRIAVRTGTTVSVDLASKVPFKTYWHNRAVRRWYPKADAVIVPSNGAADDLARTTGLARGCITAIPNPIVSASLKDRATHDVEHPWFAGDRAEPVILGVGELSPRKDFATLIRAFATLRNRRPCRLVILGEGRQRFELETLAAELDVTNHVSLPGFVDNPYAYMARADVFALCSKWEGLPTVLIEALAVGTPVVSTDCPSGPSEILEGGRHGPLVPVGDAERLARAIANTLVAPPPRNALIHAADRYRIDVAADRYLAALGLAAPDAVPAEA